MAFEPETRVETWVFQQCNTVNGRAVYRRCNFNVVRYGSDPDCFIEPRNVSTVVDTVGGTHKPVDPVTMCGQVGQFEIINSRNPVHSFDDLPVVAGADYSLPGAQ